MQLNYYILRDVVHGRPIVETHEISSNELETSFHPDEVKTTCQCCFLDIQLEDDNKIIDENKEIQELSEVLDLRLDTLEEIITDQRPRLDDYVKNVLILFKSIQKHPENLDEKTESQIGLMIYDNVVISIHLGIPISLPNLFRSFNRNPLLLIQGGITYLTTNYLDKLIDPSYLVLDGWRKFSDKVERDLLSNPKKDVLNDLIGIRQSLFDVIKIMQADKEILVRMKSEQNPIFLKDFIPPEIDDHVRHLLDESDILRSIISDLMNMYYSAESSRLNNTLARFTFMTSLLLVPSLIASIFGMNNPIFTIIPWGWAFGIMGGSMLVLYIVFKKLKLI